jgi:Holliday junction resolvasome RuvABC endonuclease subunit
MMVRTLTGLQGVIETEDASDALAVAICHATTSRAMSNIVRAGS